MGDYTTGSGVYNDLPFIGTFMKNKKMRASSLTGELLVVYNDTYDEVLILHVPDNELLWYWYCSDVYITRMNENTVLVEGKDRKEVCKFWFSSMDTNMSDCRKISDMLKSESKDTSKN